MFKTKSTTGLRKSMSNLSITKFMVRGESTDNLTALKRTSNYNSLNKLALEEDEENKLSSDSASSSESEDSLKTTFAQSETKENNVDNNSEKSTKTDKKEKKKKNKVKNNKIKGSTTTPDFKDLLVEPPRKLKKSKTDPIKTLSEKLDEITSLICKGEKRLQQMQKEEQDIKQRISLLETREKELLKSCERLAETPEEDALEAAKKTRKRTFSISYSINYFQKPVIEAKEEKISLDLRDIKKCQKLGAGSSGAVVYSVIIDGWLCAMKELSRKITNFFDEDNFEREMSILYKLPKHPNIVRYLYHKKMKGKYCLFMTKYSGTLREEIDKRSANENCFSPSVVIRIAYQIANGLTFLHDNNIMHRDLKGDNIFFTTNAIEEIENVAIGDFDTAKRIGVSELPHSTVGTQGFMAPEVLNSYGVTPYSYPADVYSFGMVLYELMTLKYPYHEMKSPVQITNAIISGKLPHLPPDIKKKFAPISDIWQKCLDPDPDRRLTALELRDKLFKLDAVANAITPTENKKKVKVDLSDHVPMRSKSHVL